MNSFLRRLRHNSKEDLSSTTTPSDVAPSSAIRRRAASQEHVQDQESFTRTHASAGFTSNKVVEQVDYYREHQTPSWTASATRLQALVRGYQTRRRLHQQARNSKPRSESVVSQPDSLASSVTRDTLLLSAVDERRQTTSNSVPPSIIFHSDSSLSETSLFHKDHTIEETNTKEESTSPWQLLVAFVVLPVLMGLMTKHALHTLVQRHGGDGMCAPVAPGTLLQPAADVVYTNEAPWWAPHAVKRPAFELLCAPTGIPRTRLQWEPSPAWNEEKPVTHQGRLTLYTQDATCSQNHAAAWRLVQDERHVEQVQVTNHALQLVQTATVSKENLLGLPYKERQWRQKVTPAPWVR